MGSLILRLGFAALLHALLLLCLLHRVKVREGEAGAEADRGRVLQRQTEAENYRGRQRQSSIEADRGRVVQR